VPDTAATRVGNSAPPSGRLRRAERRDQILAAATRAFARAGYAATNLDDVAAEAGITRVILYRHFDSKADLYRAVLDRACHRIADTVGTDDFGDDALPALLRAAAADPDGFRLLFRYAAREPEFRDVVDGLTAGLGRPDHPHHHYRGGHRLARCRATRSRTGRRAGRQDRQSGDRRSPTPHRLTH
jgi:AcrR family transcriptional regulator